ncbi:MAG TPA: LPS assembly protein LptD [Thermoanaerobaculia bacterium]|nr:LPS assembly protein LptD [Thermoanaerobaculia bacterium]
MRRIALCLLLAAAATLHAQRPKFQFIAGPKPGGGEIKITVDPGGEFEGQKDEYAIFTNNVRIEYQDIKLRADKVTINHKTKDVVAEGNVIIDQGPTRLTATQAIYNLDTKTGTFFNSTATMDPSMYFAGDRIEKVDEDTYRLSNGIFTSCDLDRPAWSFHVGSADVTVDDYAHMRNISFRARNMPVFWAPRLVWPTKKERSRGLLIPRIRLTSKFGTRLENGYFIPIGDSADATVYADVASSRYFGAGVEVRYLPSQNVKIGDFRGHLVNNVEDKQIEWKYSYKHAQENLPGGFRGVVDIQDFSNLNFFRQYDHDPNLHTASNIYSSAYLTKNRPTYSLNLIGDRRDIALLLPEPPDFTRLFERRQRYEQLPSLQLRMYPQRIGPTPFYFSMESSASRLRTSTLERGEATINADYYRADVFPTLSMQLRTPPWLSIKPQISVRETYYSASRDEFGNLQDDEPLTRFYAQGQVETVGPSFSRVFNRSMGGFSRFKHVIEPRVRYVYTTNVENQQEIARFDIVDSPFLPIVQHSVEYSLTQRLIGKEAGEGGNAREVLSFGVRQSVALSDPFPNAGTSFPTAGDHKYTPLLGSLRFNPYQSVTFDASASYGNISHQLDQVSVSANLVGTGARADKYLGLTWFALFQAPGSTFGGSSQIRLNTGSWIVKDRIRGDVQLNYNASDGRFLDQRYIAGWTGSCYGIALQYRRYLVFASASGDEELDDYGIAITLKNVGTFGSN